jgi:CRISPR-associated protein (TIGR03986 family)
MNKKENNKTISNTELSWQEQLAQKYGRTLPVSKLRKNTYSDRQGNTGGTDAVSTSILKESFYNPYTFIPFPENEIKRNKPTLLSSEEIDVRGKRITGILDLEVKTLSPLLTCCSTPSKIILKGEDCFQPFSREQKKEGHKCHDALAINNDVIVPATGIRGALRSLMTVITGGTLGYMDENQWLCQGRDKPLGPVKNSKKQPNHPLLAEVKSSKNSLEILLGKTRLVPTEKVKALFIKNGWDFFKNLPTTGEVRHFWIDNPDEPKSLSKQSNDPGHPWKLKLSGKKVNQSPKYNVKDKNGHNLTIDKNAVARLMSAHDITNDNSLFIDDSENPASLSVLKDAGHKWELNFKKGVFEILGDGINHEGCFLAHSPVKTILVSWEKWQEYKNRHRHAVRQELKPGDLVWIEPARFDCSEINSDADIKSIQWARWGRKGKSLKELLEGKHKHVVPDSLNPDGLVDTVTDLFGQVPMDREKKAAGPFAARIRPYNLVFRGAAEQHLYKNVTLAPLSSPHPGCLAFYRAGNAENINEDSPLKGYKVYRNTVERGDSAPWLFSNQGIFDEKGILKNEKQNINKTVNLLKEGREGHLRIAFQAITDTELALLLAACSVDWKLGGGKPLGLGHCRVTKIRIRDEEGGDIIPPLEPKSDERMILPEPYKSLIGAISTRIEQYHASQKPVERLRYPRAVVKNNHQNSRGGHVWFGRHAVPKKAENKNGFEPLWANDQLKDKIGGKKHISAQPLPAFDKNNPQADRLYGYDCIGDISGHKLKRLDPFDPQKDLHPVGQSSGNTSQNRDTRQKNRNNRK